MTPAAPPTYPTRPNHTKDHHIAIIGAHALFHTPEEGQGASHELSFMCDDINATVADLEAKGLTITGPVEDHGYGLITHLLLPGDLKVQLYEPRHPTAI